MHPTPGGRYATAADLAADLERWLAGDWPAAYTPTRRERLARWAGRHRPARMADVSNNLGLLLLEQGKVDPAVAVLRGGLALRDALAAEFPFVPEHREGVGEFCTNLAQALLRAGARAEAEQVIRRGIGVWDELLKEFPGTVRYDLNRFGARLTLARIVGPAGRSAQDR